MLYDKPPLTFEQQVQQLMDRGLVIADRDFAEKTLARISYYRLSAYFLPFQKNRDSFNTDTTIEKIKNLYLFDHRLRMLVYDALKVIEVALRTSITYHYAHEYGAFGYLEDKTFTNAIDHGKWLEGVQAEVDRSKEVFINHYRGKYKSSPDYPPVWMMTEVISLGSLSFFYKGLTKNIQSKIAVDFGTTAKVMGSWMHCFTYLRNTCAHHSRLWNRELAIRPLILNPKKYKSWLPLEQIRRPKLFTALTVINYCLHMRHAQDDVRLKDRLKSLLDAYPEVDYVKAMGFLPDWEDTELWNL